MTQPRLIAASALMLLGLAACNSGSTPAPGTTTPPEASAQPTSTSIPESAYPSPSNAGTAAYPSPSASP